MAVKRTPRVVQNAATELGEHLSVWRRMLNLTTQQVAERANISRDTLRRLEQGDTGIKVETLFGVLRGLGRLQAIVDAVDPYETDLGRARASQALPKRVRH